MLCACSDRGELARGTRTEEAVHISIEPVAGGLSITARKEHNAKTEGVGMTTGESGSYEFPPVLLKEGENHASSEISSEEEGLKVDVTRTGAKLDVNISERMTRLVNK